MRILRALKSVWKKFKRWCCKQGLCNLDKCKSDYHEEAEEEEPTFSADVNKMKIYPPQVEDVSPKLKCKNKGCDNISSNSYPEFEPAQYPSMDNNLCPVCDPALPVKK